ncbi:Holliday junction resolvase RuvX [Pacificimonas aurantium]|uniref:Putative pre-16S rRNA nuclease n=1 Tax=Pacificimonas aurantium TaxID=1250540 RepID=A0ABS7WL49_9SPHN|nr:Holliday junction resolvase RuvX [Pacificimonas flava]MBZ6379116.1 Holliday junction resolvase RuvX [Pacificimonas aurantium]
MHAFAAALPPEGRLAGLDLGTRSIGLAFSDSTRRQAGPGPVIRRKGQKTDIPLLQHEFSSHEISGIVLGLPLNMDGTSGPSAQRSRAFARTLEHEFDLPILLWDERLSSEAATEAMLNAGVPRMKRRERIDAFAAMLILDGALAALSSRLDGVRSSP